MNKKSSKEGSSELDTADSLSMGAAGSVGGGSAQAAATDEVNASQAALEFVREELTRRMV